tara:strand:+ start:77 stop:316 length:240 start_codon:yes stop_codon:yes gene_type:complete
MNKNSFLDYYKTILGKVSFDRQLLSKEYRKASQMLGASEVRELDSWLMRKGLFHQLDSVPYSQPKSSEMADLYERRRMN